MFMFFPNLFCIIFSLMCISITLVFLKALITLCTFYYCTLFVCKTCENITNWLVHLKCHLPNTHIYIPLFIFYGFIVFVCETCDNFTNRPTYFLLWSTKHDIYIHFSFTSLYLSIYLSIYIYIYMLFVLKWWTIDVKIYILDVSGSPRNVIAVYLCYFFIK